jgi:hypothetical protein
MANFADWGLCVKYVKRKGSKVGTAVNDLQWYKIVANRAPKKRPATLLAPLERGTWRTCAGFLASCLTEVDDTAEQNGNHRRLDVSHSTKSSFFGNILDVRLYDSESGRVPPREGCRSFWDC